MYVYQITTMYTVNTLQFYITSKKADFLKDSLKKKKENTESYDRFARWYHWGELGEGHRGNLLFLIEHMSLHLSQNNKCLISKKMHA